MTRASRDGFYFFLLGVFLFLVLGVAFGKDSPALTQDFKVVYYPARCLLRGCDPYLENDVLKVYSTDPINHSSDTPKNLQIITRCIYPPTSFFFVVPFALLPWAPAHYLWLTLTVSSLLLASFLTWDLASNHAPMVSGALVGFLLAGGEVIIVLCNPAGIAVSLCVIAVWCFVKDRFVWAGIVCFAISLALKPHDSGLIWAYLLFVGGAFRKRALQTLVAMFTLSAPGILYLSRTAPHWLDELRANVLAFSAPGGVADPSPAPMGSRGGGVLINLQTVFSFIKNEPAIDDWASYLVCALILIALALATLRTRPSLSKVWVGIAAIAPLSMLPVYHHLFDAKLLLLTLPACAMLWARRGLIGWLAILLNTTGFVLTADLPWAAFLAFTQNPQTSPRWLSGTTLLAAEILPAPLTLLAMSLFYFWIYISDERDLAGIVNSPRPHQTTTSVVQVPSRPQSTTGVVSKCSSADARELKPA